MASTFKLKIIVDPEYHANVGASGKTDAKAKTTKGETIEVGWWGDLAIKKGDVVEVLEAKPREYTARGKKRTSYTLHFPPGMYDKGDDFGGGDDFGDDDDFGGDSDPFGGEGPVSAAADDTPPDNAGPTRDKYAKPEVRYFDYRAARRRIWFDALADAELMFPGAPKELYGHFMDMVRSMAGAAMIDLSVAIEPGSIPPMDVDDEGNVKPDDIPF